MSDSPLAERLPNPAAGLVPTLYFPAHLEAAVVAYQDRLPLQAAPEVPTNLSQPCLWFDGEQLQLVAAGGVMQACVATQEVTKRAAGVSLLARACNLAPRQPIRLLDAMAGWGVDGLALQMRGAKVVQVERNPGAWALLHDLRRRFGYSTQPTDLRCADAWQVLQDSPAAAVEVVYLDPMFAPRKKTALPNKRLQLLAQVTNVHPENPSASLQVAQAGPDEGAVVVEPTLGEWIAAAQQVASTRVVVKRRLKDPPMQPSPAWQLKGKTVRYDCYPGLAAALYRTLKV